MTFTPRPAYPVAIWEEPPLSGASPFVAFGVYLRTDGYWVFAIPGTEPVGSTRGALVSAGGYASPTTSTTTGLSITRGPSGFLYPH